MKTLSSFRLTQTAKHNLEYLAKKYKLSQADIIAEMADFLSQGSHHEDAFQIFVSANKLKRSKNFRKFEAEYEKADPETQRAMKQSFLETHDDFDL